MLALLLQQAQSAGKEYAFCFWESAATVCDNLPEGATATKNAQFSKHDWSTPPAAKTLVYIAESITIKDAAFTGLENLLVQNTNFDPTLELAATAIVTLTLTTTTIAGTLLLPAQYKIDQSTGLTVNGLVTLDPSLVTASKITAAAGLTLNFAAVAKTFTDLFTGTNKLFDVSGGSITFTFPSLPEKVTLDAAKYTFQLTDPVSIITDIPNQDTTISNSFANLNLEINTDPTKSLTFNVEDQTTSLIAVSGTVLSLTQLITITATTSSFPVLLPLKLAELTTQHIFVENQKLEFKSTQDICVYKTAQSTTPCGARQTFLDTSIKAGFLDTKNSVSFIKAELDVSVFSDLDFSNKDKWITSGELILSVAADKPISLTKVLFPVGVTFAKLDNTLTITTFEAPIAAISTASGTAKIIVAAPTITLTVSDAVEQALAIFSDNAVVTLKYSDGANLALTTATVMLAATTTINTKEITLSHEIVISSVAPIESFLLMWPDSDPPAKTITLNAAENTQLELQRGFASKASLVNVHYDQVPSKPVTVNCYSDIETTPFTSKQGVIFNFDVIKTICVYAVNSADCSSGGILASELTLGEASKATSIEFHGDCTVDISVFTFNLDFTNKLYDIKDSLSLNVKDASTALNPIVLSGKTILKQAVKAQSLVAPLASIDSSIATAGIDVPIATLKLSPGSKVISTNLAQFGANTAITLSFEAAPTTLEFSDGTTVVQVKYGDATFEYSGKQKYIFGTSPSTEMAITAKAITKILPDAGAYSLPITATTKISLAISEITQAGYLTLTGIEEANTDIIVVVPTAVNEPAKGPLTGENIAFKYVVKDTSYCFVEAKGANTECFAIQQLVNAATFTGDLLGTATYIRVVGEITCELDLFTVGTQSKSVIFNKPEIFEFVGQNSMIGLLNEGAIQLVTLTLIDNIHIAAGVTTGTINTPIESLPTDSTKILTDTANVIVTPGKSSIEPTTTSALSTLAAKSAEITINVKAKNTDQLVLVYDSTDKIGGPIFCNNKFMQFTGAINYQPQTSATSLSFDIIGQVPTGAKLDLGSVAVTDQTTLTLGNGFNKEQQIDLLELKFNPVPQADYPVSVPSNYFAKNAPFKLFDPSRKYLYNKRISNICIYGKTKQACDEKEKEGYQAIAADALVDEISSGPENVYIAEAIEVDIDKFVKDSSVILNTKVFTLVGLLTLQVTQSISLTTVEIEMGMNVVIVGKAPTAQLLDIVPTITTLSCEAKVVETLTGAKVTTWNLFVDPADTKTYMIIDDAHIGVSDNCNFEVKGTEAKIVFKPSDEAQNSITVCGSTYTWPTAKAIAFGSTSAEAKLSQVDVGFVSTEKAPTLEGKYSIDLAPEGQLKVLEGLSNQPSAKNPFTVSTDKYTVLYPQSMDPKNYFIPESESIRVETWSPAPPPKPSDKDDSFPGWAIAVIVIVVVIVVAVVVVLVLNFTGVIHLCGNRDDAPSV